MFKRIQKWLLAIVLTTGVVANLYGAFAVEPGTVLYAPRPQRLAPTLNASGIFVLKVKIKTGQVTGVVIAQSTGAKILDNEAVRVLNKWRFKPGGLRPIKRILPKPYDVDPGRDSLVKVPISFR